MAVSFDRVAGIYDATRWSGVPSHIMERILAGLQNAFRDCRTILDIGIGTGRFAQYFNNKGFAVVGIDVSLSMMKQARDKGVRDLVRADAHHMPFRDQSFDGALMIHMIHLARDWIKVVHEIGRVTRVALVSEAGDSQGFDVRRNYLKLREEMGLSLPRLNEGEFELRQMIPPSTVQPTGEYSTELNAREEIDDFDARKSSVTWDVAADVHRRIMKRLHDQYDGQTVQRRDSPEVVSWDPADLRVYQLGESS